MSVTRTGKACPACGVAGVEEFGGMCAACYQKYRIETIANRVWCNYCGHTRLVKIKGQPTCGNPRCSKLLPA